MIKSGFEISKKSLPRARSVQLHITAPRSADGLKQPQTWYKPHATETHKAFPMAWALWNTIVGVLAKAVRDNADPR